MEAQHNPYGIYIFGSIIGLGFALLVIFVVRQDKADRRNAHKTSLDGSELLLEALESEEPIEKHIDERKHVGRTITLVVGSYAKRTSSPRVKVGRM